MENKTKIWLWLAVYAVAMAALESAVVVYLRELYYGNNAPLFPIREMSPHLAYVELARELATVLMLVAVGYLCGSNAWSRFGYFLVAFGVWDIFYYVFLYVFMQWPESLLSWDILFLIPVPWFGPVLAPCLVSLAMIAFGVSINRNKMKTHALAARWMEGIPMLAGCLTILFTFVQDSIHLISQSKINPGDEHLLLALAGFVPQHYSWTIFGIGYLLLLTGIILYHRRVGRTNQVLY